MFIHGCHGSRAPEQYPLQVEDDFPDAYTDDGEKYAEKMKTWLAALLFEPEIENTTGN